MSIEKINQSINRFGTNAVGTFLENHTSQDRSELINDPDIPTGTINITENGTYDIGAYASADVDVPQDFTVDENYTVSEGVLSAASVELVGDVVAHIPKGVVTVGNKAFMNNTTVNKVIMPDSVTNIEDGIFQYPSYPNNATAFGNCTALKEVVLSKNLTSIGDNAFYGCTGLTSIIIPDSVTSIGISAFYNCSGLTTIVIPDGVTSIGGSTFNGCAGLTTITIPDGVTSIGNGAFYNCSGLTTIVIPDGVTSIGDSAFENCGGLTFITIPDSVTSIGGGTFTDCTGLTTITIPDGVTSIGSNAFSGCTSLTSIVIGDGVTIIGNSAFYECSSLTDIYYTGTQAEWEQITIGTNAIPQGVTIHYDYVPSDETQKTPEENPEIPAE